MTLFLLAGCGDGAPASPFPDAEIEAFVDVLKAVADPIRLRLFVAIAAVDGTTCVCHLPEVGVSQPTVSHHLRRLKEAGLIESERRGTWVHYRPTPNGRRVAEALRLVAPFV